MLALECPYWVSVKCVSLGGQYWVTVKCVSIGMSVLGQCEMC